MSTPSRLGVATWFQQNFLHLWVAARSPTAAGTLMFRTRAAHHSGVIIISVRHLYLTVLRIVDRMICWQRTLYVQPGHECPGMDKRRCITWCFPILVFRPRLFSAESSKTVDRQTNYMICFAASKPEPNPRLCWALM